MGLKQPNNLRRRLRELAPCRIKIQSCRIKIQLIVAAEFPRPLAGDEGNRRTLSQE